MTLLVCVCMFIGSEINKLLGSLFWFVSKLVNNLRGCEFMDIKDECMDKLYCWCDLLVVMVLC